MRTINATHLCNLFCSVSRGLIFSRTIEYWTLALTHAAKGAAAADARCATFGVNESSRRRSNLSTLALLSASICLASKFLIKKTKHIKI